MSRPFVDPPPPLRERCLRCGLAYEPSIGHLCMYGEDDGAAGARALGVALIWALIVLVIVVAWLVHS